MKDHEEISAPMHNRRIRVCVQGRVQGVFFRANTKKQAESLDLTGWVRNLDDGRVEAVFEGENAEIEKIKAWCSKGSGMAQVDHVAVFEESFRGEFIDFEIRY